MSVSDSSSLCQKTANQIAPPVDPGRRSLQSEWKTADKQIVWCIDFFLSIIITKTTTTLYLITPHPTHPYSLLICFILHILFLILYLCFVIYVLCYRCFQLCVLSFLLFFWLFGSGRGGAWSIIHRTLACCTDLQRLSQSKPTLGIQCTRSRERYSALDWLNRDVCCRRHSWSKWPTRNRTNQSSLLLFVPDIKKEQCMLLAELRCLLQTRCILPVELSK